MIDFPIVDAHVHLLDIKRFGYSWAKGAPALNRDWTPDDLAARAKPYAIESFVFVEVDVDMPQYIDEARWVNGIAGRDPRLRGCVAALPLERGPAIEPELAILAQMPIVRGARRLIQNQPDGFALEPAFIEAVKLLPRYGLSFDVCVYHRQMAEALAFMGRCPDVSFVLDHIGKPGIEAGLMDPWRGHLRAMAALPNVVCKLSGLTTEADHDVWTPGQLRPYIDHVIESFGFDRLMYGGDWPVCELAGSYTAWLDVLDRATAGCAAAERRKLFRDNAIRVYRL